MGILPTTGGSALAEPEGGEDATAVLPELEALALASAALALGSALGAVAAEGAALAVVVVVADAVAEVLAEAFALDVESVGPSDEQPPCVRTAIEIPRAGLTMLRSTNEGEGPRGLRSSLMGRGAYRISEEVAPRRACRVAGFTSADRPVRLPLR